MGEMGGKTSPAFFKGPLTVPLPKIHNIFMQHYFTIYPSTLASLTLIILFSEMLKVFKKLFLPNRKIYVKENSG